MFFFMSVYKREQLIFDLPDSNGFIFHDVTGPCDVNWPSASSMKNKGSPTIKVMMIYGRRKAAEIDRGRQ